MTYSGHVKEGVVVFDEPVRLTDGTAVRIEVVDARSTESVEATSSLTNRLSDINGQAVGLPEDAAVNHDHYLYGAPRR